MNSLYVPIWLVLLLIFCHADNSRADTFGNLLGNSFDMEFVTIGDSGNAPDFLGDPSPAGAVNYDYRVSKFEVSEAMIDVANDLGGLGIIHDGRGPDKPATSVSWYEATQFINWLNETKGYSPAYKFDNDEAFQLWEPVDAGYDPTNPYRNTLAHYFLPSADEWYKAAYYDPDSGVYCNYPTGCGDDPTPVASGTTAETAVFDGQAEPADVMFAGGFSPYGTMGQGGNVMEWEETAFDLSNDLADEDSGVRGGSWSDIIDSLLKAIREGVQKDGKVQIIGMRVASKPEPFADFDGSGTVDGLDFLLWQRDPSIGNLADWESQFGIAVPPPLAALVATPEPSTLLLASLTGVLIGFRRRRS